MNFFHIVLAHIKGDIRHEQDVVGKELLDVEGLVIRANDEVIYAEVEVGSQEVLLNGLGADIGIFVNTSSGNVG
jgi:hypothetical protein